MAGRKRRRSRASRQIAAKSLQRRAPRETTGTPAFFKSPVRIPPLDRQKTAGSHNRRSSRVTSCTNARSAPPGSRSVMQNAMRRGVAGTVKNRSAFHRRASAAYTRRNELRKDSMHFLRRPSCILFHFRSPKSDPARGRSHQPGVERSDTPGQCASSSPTPEGSQHSTDDHIFQGRTQNQDAGTPPVQAASSLRTGGIAALNPRLMACTPTGVLPHQSRDKERGHSIIRIRTYDYPASGD